MNNRNLSPAIVPLAWASFISQVLIVITGGAVRLTASGLGCDQWPQCTPGKFVTTPEQGIHGAIEFGNRTLTFVLIIIAVATLITVWRQRPVRKDLRVLVLIPFVGIIMQAIIGGVSVLLRLNPWVVGFHFVVSAGLVAATAVLVERVHTGDAPRRWLVVGPVRTCALVTAALAAITICLGIVATGAGPHAGDAQAPRNGLSVLDTYRVHALASYLLLAATIVSVVLVRRSLKSGLGTGRLYQSLVWLLGIEIVQAAVGITQANLGVPALLVGIHMGLAVLLAGTTAVMVTRLRISDLPTSGSPTSGSPTSAGVNTVDASAS